MISRLAAVNLGKKFTRTRVVRATILSTVMQTNHVRMWKLMRSLIEYRLGPKFVVNRHLELHK